MSALSIVTKARSITIAVALSAALTTAIIACGSDTAASPTAAPTPTVAPTVTPSPTATPTPVKTAPQLKYLLIDHYNGIFYCDPYQYPLARPDEELRQALLQFADIQANTDEYEAIMAHLYVDGTPDVTDQFKLEIFREHNRLAAVTLTRSSAGYTYSLRTGDEGGNGYAVTGTITETGQVMELNRAPAANVCPICLAAGATIDTPNGPVPVTEITTGMLVWTLDNSGARIAAPVLVADSVEAPPGHVVINIVLSDGRALTASPGHPLADGRLLGEVRPGDTVDGATVLSTAELPYTGRTYDLLPTGGTGVYWADGVPVGSTLTPR